MKKKKLNIHKKHLQINYYLCSLLLKSTAISIELRTVVLVNWERSFEHFCNLVQNQIIQEYQK